MHAALRSKDQECWLEIRVMCHYMSPFALCEHNDIDLIQQITSSCRKKIQAVSSLNVIFFFFLKMVALQRCCVLLYQYGHTVICLIYQS
jgi:hypothetical protein